MKGSERSKKADSEKREFTFWCTVIMCQLKIQNGRLHELKPEVMN